MSIPYFFPVGTDPNEVIKFLEAEDKIDRARWDEKIKNASCLTREDLWTIVLARKCEIKTILNHVKSGASGDDFPGQFGYELSQSLSRENLEALIRHCTNEVEEILSDLKKPENGKRLATKAIKKALEGKSL